MVLNTCGGEGTCIIILSNNLFSLYWLFTLSFVIGGKPVKVVYVDSPLPKKEMTMREKNQMFHEITLNFLVSKKSYAPMSMVLMDKPVEENMFQWNVCCFICYKHMLAYFPRCT